ncbi:MAG: phosphoribosylformylglycinamidine synthase subunit PurL [Verrucomicrobiae bacterium]|nr:phosphoribosylformylglycinamidine synthase subunit PurL [Verrucomicrobiae bacterium]
MQDIVITPQVIAKHGLTPDEFALIQKILGREPNITELGIFSVMWSEHCSYKSSRPILKLFPRDGANILVKAGEENAGIVDIGGGWAMAFKIESHNHPSAVEPFQGAATGVGGIIRDIFTMGARPIAGLNSLRFGPIEAGSNNGGVTVPVAAVESNDRKRDACATNKRLFSGVVSGIAHYGNCFGIPTVGGEVYFDKSYDGNPLVNALCVGVLRHEQIARGKATGVGNPVYYVGAATGRDGLAGAAFASRELTEESQKDRPAVQVGDPFMEKLLMEACLELLASGCVVGIQDMGAAGLTCSTCETASRGGSGIEIELNKVPQRETGMTPYEIMLSESQERMLIIVQKGKEEPVERIFQKWDLHAANIGTVTGDGIMRVKHNGKVVSEIPARQLAEDAPVYNRPSSEPKYLAQTRAWKVESLKEPDAYQYTDILKQLLASPTIANKNWVYRQYDHMVRTNAIVYPGSDAAVMRVKLTPEPMPGHPDTTTPPKPREVSPLVEPDFSDYKFFAFSTDCNGTYCYLDPFEGGKIAVAEAARNVVCSGATPVAVTDNLNFGSPMDPGVMWQFKECCRGITEACNALKTPVTGGNVSFYNESPQAAIDPTPTIGMLGLIDDPRHITTQWFKTAGDYIILIGECSNELGGSEYTKRIHGLKTGQPPRLDLTREKAVQDAVLGGIRSGLLKSAHDCSEGGLAVALAECCISNREVPLGANVDLAPLTQGKSIRNDALLFGETQSRVIVTCRKENLRSVQLFLERRNVPVTLLGQVGGDMLIVRSGDNAWQWRVSELSDLWYNSIARLMEAS